MEPQQEPSSALESASAAVEADEGDNGIVRPLAPNHYIMLVGPPASGKNWAIEQAERMIPNDLKEIVNLRDGRTTGPALLNRLGQHLGVDTPPPYAYTWVCMPELASSVGSGEHATTLIAILTEMYTAGKRYSDDTVTRGEIIVEDPCINWTAGSTEAWVRKAITADAIEGGFWSRVVVSYLPRKWWPAKDIPCPKLPATFNKDVKELRQRLRDIARLAGDFKLTPTARKLFYGWLMGRKRPEDPLDIPWHKRSRDHIAKLAMVLAVAERPELVIQEHHIEEAIKRIAAAGITNRLALEEITAPSTMTVRNRVLDAIMEFGDEGAPRAALYRRVHNWVATARDLDDIMALLTESKLVDVEEVKGIGRPAKVYYATTFARDRQARQREGMAEMVRGNK
jgi:hypothetical protein